MRDAQRAVDAVAVARLRTITIPACVAPVAHVMSAKAVEDGDVAAVHALPVDLCFAVLFTHVFTSSELFQDAILA